jgi:hypothetical protein
MLFGILLIGGICSITAYKASLQFLSRDNAVITLLTCLGITVLASIWFIIKRDRKNEKRRKEQAKEQALKDAKLREQALKDAKLRNQKLMQNCSAMVQKLQSTGFSSLNQVEKKYLFKLSDQMGSNLENLHESEVKVLEVAFSNQSVNNMLQMRSNQLQSTPNKQANKAVLGHLRGIQVASMVSGINAAREIGEDIAEDMAEDMPES